MICKKGTKCTSVILFVTASNTECDQAFNDFCIDLDWLVLDEIEIIFPAEDDD